MPTRTDAIATDLPRPAAQHWRLNSGAHIVDADHTSSGWGLADELVRLQIADVGKDNDDLNRPMRTPPKTKLPSSVSHLNESSPLDTSSNTSLGSSPHTPDHQLNVTHSRDSSTDSTTSGSHDSSPGVQNALLNHNLQGTALEPKERPHSFSGGLSSADLRRLQQMGDTSDDPGSQQWASNHLRENGALPNEQPMYPTLTQIHRPQPLSHPQLFDYRNAMHESAASDRDELQIDYNLSQRYPTAPQGLPMATLPPHPSFVAGRLNNVVPNVGYRQPPRVFPQQALLPNPSPLAFPVGHHTSHLSLGNTQQLYEMMIPSAPDSHPAVARVQQQHNIFRGGHHHSASDPSVMRDATSHSILNGIHSFNPGLYPPTLHPSMPVFPNQFYTTQDAVASRLADLSGVQFAAAYIPSQNTGTEVSATTPTAGTSQTGPSANNRKLGLYKTELCRSWEEKGTCRYGAKCQFAHGEDELRKVARHPKVRLHLYF